MAKLAVMETGLGRIVLHWRDGKFITRRKFTLRDGTPYKTDILLSPVMARHWYDLACRRGITYKPFPEVAS